MDELEWPVPQREFSLELKRRQQQVFISEPVENTGIPQQNRIILVEEICLAEETSLSGPSERSETRVSQKWLPPKRLQKETAAANQRRWSLTKLCVRLNTFSTKRSQFS